MPNRTPTGTPTIPGCYPPGLDPFVRFELAYQQRVAELVPGYPAAMLVPDVEVALVVDPVPTTSSAPRFRLLRGKRRR